MRRIATYAGIFLMTSVLPASISAGGVAQAQERSPTGLKLPSQMRSTLEVRAMKHPLTQARGFWVPLEIFVELEADQARAKSCAAAQAMQLTRYGHLAEAFKVLTTTATVGISQRDRCREEKDRLVGELEDRILDSSGDAWWVRGLTFAGGVAACGLGAYLSSQ